MDKQLQVWIDVLEHTNINSEALNELIRDMKRAQEEAEKGVMPCQTCGEKIIGTWHCKQCAHKMRPWDTEI